MQRERKFQSISVTEALSRLGLRIRAARRARGLTLIDIHNSTRIDRSTLGRLERGDPGVSIGILMSVLEALGETSDIELIVSKPAADPALVRPAMGAKGARTKPILDGNF